MMDDVQEDLVQISHKLEALQVIIKRHGHPRAPKHIKERLKGLSE
jgi:hypothetical protein